MLWKKNRVYAISLAFEQTPRYLEIIYMHGIHYGIAHPTMRHLFFAMLPKMVTYLVDQDHSWMEQDRSSAIIRTLTTRLPEHNRNDLYDYSHCLKTPITCSIRFSRFFYHSPDLNPQNRHYHPNPAHHPTFRTPLIPGSTLSHTKYTNDAIPDSSRKINENDRGGSDKILLDHLIR